MKILTNKQTINGSTMKGECVMLHKYGQVYPCIDNVMHPNPGTEEDEYSEMERTVDWLYQNDLRHIFSNLELWLRCRLSYEFVEGSSLEDSILNTMFCEIYNPCDTTISKIKDIWSEYENDPSIADADTHLDELAISRTIAKYLNETFLRVRAGGKLNPEGSNSIYFRISSHGYDWHSVILDFLWDTFGSTDQMPSKIWIGHDAETNPPETVLFYGQPNELFEGYDGKVFASNKQLDSKSDIMNGLRINMLKNKNSLINCKNSGSKYIAFK